MYEPDTILILKKPRDPDPETNEPFAYNRVKVLGPSPVGHVDKGTWKGADATGVLIQGLSNFGATLDEPFGKLRTLYAVESIPERETEANVVIKRINATSEQAGPTPEEVFAEKAPGKPAEPGAAHSRARTPLGDPGGPEDAEGPLGEVEAPEPTAKQTREDVSPI